MMTGLPWCFAGVSYTLLARFAAEPLPEWFRPFAIHEAAATALYNTTGRRSLDHDDRLRLWPMMGESRT
jgi:hypothetical protein